MNLNKRVKYEPITIKEPHKGDVKYFSDTDEFTQYYRQHEDDFKGVSTIILNRNYKIPGYRITVTKRGTDDEELMLKKDYYNGVNNKITHDVNTTTADLIEHLKLLSERVDNIERYLCEIK